MSQRLWRLEQKELESLRVLYLTKFAPMVGDPPPPEVDPIVGREKLTKYEVHSALTGLGLTLERCRTVDEFRAYRGDANYCFCLYNREAIRNPETVVASLCAVRGLAHLGAPPNIRAAGEDKLITKALFRMAGASVVAGRAYTKRDELTEPPEFPPPYFVKPRFGANSEMVGEHSIARDWNAARQVAESLLAEGEEALVEELIDGRDITVTVLQNGDGPFALTPTLFRSELPFGIATERQKRLLDRGRRGEPLNEPELAEVMKKEASRIAGIFQPFDYMRVDFRQRSSDGRLLAMEVNLTSNLGTHAATGIAIANDGIAHAALIEHILAYSVRRQGVLA